MSTENMTIDKPALLQSLANTLWKWPGPGAVLSLGPMLPEPWTWVLNHPSVFWTAANTITLETITVNEWRQLRAAKYDEALLHLAGTLDWWPTKHAYDTRDELPNRLLWQWTYDKEALREPETAYGACLVYEQIHTGQKIYKGDWQAALKAKTAPGSKVKAAFETLNEDLQNASRMFRTGRLQQKDMNVPEDVEFTGPRVYFEYPTPSALLNLSEVDVPGYESLRNVLEAAYDQAARGKGKERHAKDLPFHQQRMQTIRQLINSERGMAYQICKKVVEGLDLETHEARKRELLGAINYIAGVIIYWDQQVGTEDAN